MNACTFLGHGNCPECVLPELRKAIRTQIEGGTTDFLVGCHGNFDRMALACLRALKKEYPALRYGVVTSPDRAAGFGAGETVVPDGVENVPPRFVIDFCNKWMLRHADSVIVYVTRSFGGAAKYAAMAERQGKPILKL